MSIAKQFTDYGLSIIPVGKDKRPLFSWKDFQSRIVSDIELTDWNNRYPEENLAMVTGRLSGVCVVDIDNMDDAKDSIKNLFSETMNPLVVKTPRGGYHWWFKMPPIDIGNNAKTVPGCDFRGEGGYVLIPPSKREDGVAYEFLNFSEELLKNLPPLPEAYIKYVTGNDEPKKPIYSSGDFLSEGKRDNDLFHVANCLAKGGLEQDLAKEVIRTLADKCSFPEKEADLKVYSAYKRVERNLASEVEEFVLSTEGNFLSTDVHKCLQVSTRQDLKNVSEILSRLKKRGLIESYGTRNGSFRLIDQTLEEIDYTNVSPESIDLRLPLDIHKLAKIHRKNIIILAGTSNAGKTSFLMNVVEMNMHKFDVSYFSSEMGAEELRGRMEAHKTPLKDWRWKVYERAENFSDVIRPNGLNIIDYLEVIDDAYKMQGYIRQIFHKLENGVAFIALQKKPGLSDGVGGFQTRDKARLYITMEKDKVKLEKVKHRACQKSPTGAEIKFEVIQKGSMFVPRSEWLMDNTMFHKCELPEGYDPYEEE